MTTISTGPWTDANGIVHIRVRTENALRHALGLPPGGEATGSLHGVRDGLDRAVRPAPRLRTGLPWLSTADPRAAT